MRATREEQDVPLTDGTVAPEARDITLPDGRKLFLGSSLTGPAPLPPDKK